jgi:hypothetical protein
MMNEKTRNRKIGQEKKQKIGHTYITVSPLITHTCKKE